MPRTVLLLAVAALFATGCTRVVVHKDPGRFDKGIRYYRPKPYLFIAPGEASSNGDDKTLIKDTRMVEQINDLEVKLTQAIKSGALQSENQLADYEELSFTEDMPTPDCPTKKCAAEDDDDCPPPSVTKVSMSLMYMPDFAEEYSIQLKPGLGVGELSLELDNGWNLTSVGMKTDQQTDEIITSVANLVSSLSDAANNMTAARQKNGANCECSLYATNIPFGFYEAVIATDPCGRKQLYGWRYIGFMPFQACPTTACGLDQVSCHDPTTIYGMVIRDDGVLVFEPIANIPRSGMSDPEMAPYENTGS